MEEEEFGLPLIRDTFEENDMELEDFPLAYFGRANRGRFNQPNAQRPRDIKVKLETFDGSNDSEKYIEWETHTSYLLDHLRYDEAERLEVVTLHLTGIARQWWFRTRDLRRRQGKEPVETWPQLRWLMRKRHVPDEYVETQRLKLAGLRQGSMTPMEFRDEIERVSHQANIYLTDRSTCRQFLAGLHKSISDPLAIHGFKDINTLTYKA